MQKINFSGGEPFLVNRGTFVGELLRFCKDELGVRSCSVVSNGSLITEAWMWQYGIYLDILAVSCDSFQSETNKEIGRCTKTNNDTKNHVEILHTLVAWCRKYKVAFKLNTVVNAANMEERMACTVNTLHPIRWKLFQCLLIEGENCGEGALRSAHTLSINNDQFDAFVKMQKEDAMPSLHIVPENNAVMRNSYLILDERMRFLNCSTGRKIPSESILDVGVQDAIQHAAFDICAFHKRGGQYKWTKKVLHTPNNKNGCHGCQNKTVDMQW